MTPSYMAFSTTIIHQLLHHKLVQSAVIVSQYYYYSYQTANNVSSNVIYDLAQSYIADKQIKRSVQLLEQLYVNPLHTQWLNESSVSTPHPPPPPPPQSQSNNKLSDSNITNKLNVMLDVLQCYIEQKEYKQSIHIFNELLQLINVNNSSSAIYNSIDPIVLSKICHICVIHGNTIQKQLAVTGYKILVQLYPYDICSYLRLIELNIDIDTVLSSSNNSINIQQHVDINSGIGEFMYKLCHAHQYTIQYKHQQSIDLYNQLNIMQHQHNPYILCRLAHAHTQISDLSISQHYYESALKCDPYELYNISWYSLLLYKRGDKAKLHQVTNMLLSTLPHSIDTWTSCALLYAIDNIQKAQQYIKKSLTINNTHIPTLLTHSIVSILCAHIPSDQSSDNGVMAVQSCRHALLLCPWEMSIYMLLANGYIDSSNEVKMSWHIVQKALELNKKNPKFLTLAGSVLLHNVLLNNRNQTSMSQQDHTMTDSLDKAEKLLLRSLQFDSNHLDSILTLCDLYMYKKQYQSAIDLLHNLLSPHAVQSPATDTTCNTALQQYDVIHCKLGQLYSELGKLDLALQHIHTALKLSPQYQPAVLALQSIENELKGNNDESEVLNINEHNMNY